MGDSFDSQMTIYFDDFKNSMKKRMRIPVSLVDQHDNEFCFLVDIDFTYIQAVIPRVRWLRPLGYELDIDQTLVAITTFLVEETDKAAQHFGTYDVKSRVVIDLKTTSATRRKDKLVKKLKKRFGADLGEEGTTEEAEETSDDDGDEDKGEDEPD